MLSSARLELVRLELSWLPLVRLQLAWGRIFPYFPASDLFSRVAGGLRGEIIPMQMQDDGPSQYFPDGESLIKKCSPGVASAAHKRQQVPCMFRMGLISRIVMHAGFIKGQRTVSKFMNVHGKKMAANRGILIRQPGNLRQNQHSRNRQRIKEYLSFQRWGAAASTEHRNSLRRIVIHHLQKQVG